MIDEISLILEIEESGLQLKFVEQNLRCIKIY